MNIRPITFADVRQQANIDLVGGHFYMQIVKTAICYRGELDYISFWRNLAPQMVICETGCNWDAKALRWIVTRKKTIRFQMTAIEQYYGPFIVDDSFICFSEGSQLYTIYPNNMSIPELPPDSQGPIDAFKLDLVNQSVHW